MKKLKSQRLVCFLLIAVSAIVIQPRLYGQNYLSKERENEIKMSGNYYWGEGSDFIEELAKLSASVELSNHIIQDAVGQSEQLDEILKAIDTGAHLDRLPQQGKIKILAWIAKESVMLTVTVQRPITQNYEPQYIPSVHVVQDVEDPVIVVEERFIFPDAFDSQPVIAPTPERVHIATDNPVLQQLAACRNYGDVRRVATMNGLVRGEFGKGSKGFSNPDNCIIAVFNSGGLLEALLDAGGSSRIDLLSGISIQNPERYYNRDYLWYMQVKKASSGEYSNIQDSRQYQTQNNYSPANNSLRVSPPIENTNRYANACVLLPKDWDGKSVLVNEFVWIWTNDIKLQNKYNIHPGDEYGFENEHESWDDDDTFYKYPLSPNVVIEAGIMSELCYPCATRRMTVNEFANYMRSLGYAIEGEGSFGIVANVTYKDGMITKIKEVYTP